MSNAKSIANQSEPEIGGDFDHWEKVRRSLQNKSPEYQGAAAYTALIVLSSDIRSNVVEAVTGGVGAPFPPLLDLLDEAKWWSSLASSEERRAYSALGFLRMNKGDRKDFLTWGAKHV